MASFGLRLLPAALLHPGPRHRPVADRARRGGLAAFVVVLSRPGARPDHLWLRLRPWRTGADHLVRRAGGAGRRHCLFPDVAPADLHEPDAQHHQLPDLRLGVERARDRSGGAADRGGFLDLDHHRGAAGGGLRGLRPGAAGARADGGRLRQGADDDRVPVAARRVVVPLRRRDRLLAAVRRCASWPARPAAAASRSAWRSFPISCRWRSAR